MKQKRRKPARRTSRQNRALFTTAMVVLIAVLAFGAYALYHHLGQGGKEASQTSSKPGSDVSLISSSGVSQTEQTSDETSEQAPSVSSTAQVTQPSGENWALILANPTHALPDGFSPETEEVQNGYEMDTRVAPIARQMIRDARAQGVELLVCSAYRPYSSQERLFNNKVVEYKNMGYNQSQAEKKAATIVAVPGTSEHQTGLCLDIVTPSYQGLDDGYANTAAAKWLYTNAADYGFILRFPKDKQEITKIIFEPWHYRYVGVDAAKEIMSKGICLEEYLNILD